MSRSDGKGPAGRCDFCGQMFKRTRRHKRFCSASCRNKHWIRLHPRQRDYTISDPTDLSGRAK